MGAGTVVFCGTLPLPEGAIVHGSHYELGLGLPDGTGLDHSYFARRREA